MQKKKIKHFVFIFKLTISCSSLQRTVEMLHSFETRFDWHCRLPQNTSCDVSLIGRTKPVIKNSKPGPKHRLSRRGCRRARVHLGLSPPEAIAQQGVWLT